MSSQDHRELLLWSTSWLARPSLQFPAILQRSTDSKLWQSSLGLPEEQDLLSHAKVKACFESQDHKRVPCNPSVDGSEFDPQHEETSPAVHWCGGRYLWALDVNPQLCYPQTNGPFFRANKNLKKSLSFIQSRVQYSRSYLRNLVVKINFDRSWELCNNSVNF